MLWNGSPTCLLQHQRNPPQTHDQKTVNKLPRFPENTATTAMIWKNVLLSSQKTWWRKRGENPRSNTPLLSRKPRKMMEKTQGPTCPCYLENQAKWWRKPLEKSTQHMQVHSDHKQTQLAGTSQAWSTGEWRGHECWIKYPPTYWIFK